MSNVQQIGSKEEKNLKIHQENFIQWFPSRIGILSFNHRLHFRQLFKENRELRNCKVILFPA